MSTKTALITGASSGIGLEFARIFAMNNCNVIITARTEENLITLAKELTEKYKIEVRIIVKDLSIPTAPQEIYDELKLENIEVEYLINNAGFGGYGKFHTTDWTHEEKMIQVNITSLVNLSKLFVKDMVKRNSGRILNVASTAAFQPGPLMSIYYASKAFVVSFSEAMAYELKDTNVTVTALCPGPTKSNFHIAANIKESKLTKGRHIPTSYDVALFGYKAMMKGKTTVIEGAMNKFLRFASWILPMKTVLATVYKLQKDREPYKKSENPD